LHLPIAQLGDTFVVSGKANSTDYSINLSGLSYVYSILGGDNTAAKNAVSALYDYYSAAIAYIAAPETNDGILETD
jgi:hypothetical protein